MADVIIKTRNKPRRTIVRDMLHSTNCVRTYRCSPEDVMMQIRLDKAYVSVALSFDEAREFATAMLSLLPPK